ncbi:hypothetical protein [Alkalibacillus haloalkaliphilus]|uniref:hypothetical protein n=1 Tax=Alkalibacillus haloalkaliphilus TaxID=94136 RepID=UPI0029364419|nr:hypothetical protein [Alkalibacillus haloalkaliphilus]MDV2582381.1 hypothetical protein [Alkalibacillus haloalkaliphilus]
MKAGVNLFKESIRLPLIFFVVAIVWQFIFNNEVQWVDHAGVSFIMFWIILFLNWSNKPYKWKKDHIK